MRNKIISLSLVGVLLVLLLTGCGSNGAENKKGEGSKVEDNSKGTEVKDTEENTEKEVGLIVSWWGNQTRNERTQQVMDLYTQKNPNVTFDGQFAEWADYWNKLSTASAGHTLPDVVQMDYKYLEQYVSNNLLVDLMPYIADGTLDVSGVDENILNSGKIGDGLYAIPIGVNAPALLYNKTLLDQNGITIKDNMSLDEFIALSKEIYEKTGYKTDVSYGNGDNFIEYTMRSLGAVLYEKDKLGATQEQLEKFFEIYENGIADGWLCDPRVYTERTIGTPEQMPLVYGSSPATMSWCAFSYSNALTALQNAAAEGTEIAMTTWPANDQEAANYLRPGMFFSVTVDSKNPAGAVKFVDYWTNDIPANEILLGERGVPASAAVSEGIMSQMDEINLKIISYINYVVTPTSSVINPPAPEGSAEVSKLIDQLVETVCYKQMSAKDAAAELSRKGNEMLAR